MKQRNYSHTDKWGSINCAAARWGCKTSDLERWALAGLIYGYHKRGKKGGWWFNLDARPDIMQLEIDDSTVIDAKARLNGQGTLTAVKVGDTDWVTTYA